MWMVLTFMLLSLDSAASLTAGLRRERRQCEPDRMVVFALGKTVPISPGAVVSGYEIRRAVEGARGILTSRFYACGTTARD